MVGTYIPPWQKLKSKQVAWERGQDQGYQDGVRASEINFRAEKEKLIKDCDDRKANLDALRLICQTGSTVIESMAKALLSVNKNL